MLLDSDIATAVAWSPDSQLFSCSDDKEICKWSAEGEAAGKFSVNNVYISSISWFPTLGKQVNFAYPCMRVLILHRLRTCLR